MYIRWLLLGAQRAFGDRFGPAYPKESIPHPDYPQISVCFFRSPSRLLFKEPGVTDVADQKLNACVDRWLTLAHQLEPMTSPGRTTSNARKSGCHRNAAQRRLALPSISATV